MSNGDNGINYYVDFGSFNDGIQANSIFHNLKETTNKDISEVAELLNAGKMPALGLIGEYIVKEIRGDILTHQAYAGWKDPTFDFKQLPEHLWDTSGRRIEVSFFLRDLVGVDAWKHFEETGVLEGSDPSRSFGLACSFSRALKNVLSLTNCLTAIKIRPSSEEDGEFSKTKIEIQLVYRRV